MTNLELAQYYVKLLIIQYANKPKAKATVEANALPVIMDQLPAAVQDAFNLETAAGVQLDIIGKYAGVSRNALIFSGPIVLDDDDFRTLIKIKIIQNNAGSSLYEIQKLLSQFFGPAIRVFDYANMHMSYFFESTYGSAELAEVFVRQGMLPKPMGVQLAALIYAPTLTNVFGFRTYSVSNPEVSGFNSYSDYQTDAPWISYTDAIVP